MYPISYIIPYNEEIHHRYIMSCQIPSLVPMKLNFNLIHHQDNLNSNAEYKDFIFRSRVDVADKIMYKIHIINFQYHMTYQHHVSIKLKDNIRIINHCFMSQGIKLKGTIINYVGQESLYCCRIPYTPWIFIAVVNGSDKIELKAAIFRSYY
jgi:hypothetical protein